MASGQVIYGVGGLRDYAFAPPDERALFALGADADQLLGRLIAGGQGALAPEDLGDLPLCDYELILAHLYRAMFGEVISQNVDCAACHKKFSVDFSLADWVGQIRGGITPERAREFDGAGYRLPTRAILRSGARDPGALARRLWQGAAPLAPNRLADFEAQVARDCPVLQDDIEAPCPRCSEVVRKRFVLRAHLATRLAGRLRALLRDIHVLASSYHWSAAEILGLPRQTRAALIDTIRRQAQRRQALRSG